MIRASLCLLALLLGTAVRGDERQSSAPTPNDVMAPPPRPLAEVPTVSSLSVKLLGQPDAVRGDLVPLQAVTTGNVSAYKWLVSPAVAGLAILDGGRSAVFANRSPGVYRVIVAVAGDGAVDVAEHEFEIVDGPSAGNPEPSPARISDRQLGPGNVCGRHRTLEDDMIQMLNRVPSRGRISEAKILGSCFRTTANRIESGLFPAGADPMSDVEHQTVLALGTMAPAWQGVLNWTRDYLSKLRQQGLATTPATTAPILSELASILARVQ